MSQHENSPRFDISTFLPVGLGVISLFGICLLLLASRFAAPRAIVDVPDTATPFRYLFLGTEPGIATPVPIEEVLGTRPVGFAVTAQSGFSGADGASAPVAGTRLVTRTAIQGQPGLLSPTSTLRPTFSTRFPTVTGAAITNTPISLPSLPGTTATFPPASTLTPTSVAPAPLRGNTYDDTDPHLIYSGNWASQTGQPGAEGGTLHVSSTLNNTITFRFIGDQFRIIYQSGSGLGTMTVVMDGTIFPALNQSGPPSTRGEWSASAPSNATHVVTITHSSGGSVNIDQVIVPDVATTPTPTATATSTP